MEFSSYKDLHRIHQWAALDLEVKTSSIKDEHGRQDQNEVVSASYVIVGSFEAFEIIDRPDEQSRNPAELAIERLCEKAIQWLDSAAFPKIKWEDLTPEEQTTHTEAQHCYACKKPFQEEEGPRKKVMDHDHYTGKYRGAACHSCNGKMKDDKFMIVLTHNFEKYDGPHLIRAAAALHATARYSHYRMSALPRNRERIVTFQFGPLKFIDSLHFYQASLAEMMQAQLQDGSPEDVFPLMKKWHPYRDHLSSGVLTKKMEDFPYKRLDIAMASISLPLPRQDYNNDLKGTECSEESYAEILEVHDQLGFKTFKDMHDCYLATDVLGLADCMGCFRDMIFENEGLDIFHSLTMPSVSGKSVR